MQTMQQAGLCSLVGPFRQEGEAARSCEAGRPHRGTSATQEEAMQQVQGR